MPKIKSIAAATAITPLSCLLILSAPNRSWAQAVPDRSNQLRPGEFVTNMGPICAPPDTTKGSRPDSGPISALEKRIHDNWIPTYPIKTSASVVAVATDDGKLYDIKIEQTSGNAQIDADCLQAVMGASETTLLNVEEGRLKKLVFTFDQNTERKHKVNGIANYLAAHPDQRNKCIVFYRIPLEVLKRYPGLFTESELLTDVNIGVFEMSDHRSALADSDVEKLRFIYQTEWVPFFRGNPKATKEQIQVFSERLPMDERERLNENG